jgi:hypothetical protein
VISAAIDAYLMFGLAEAKALGKALRSSEADFKKAWYRPQKIAADDE